MLLAIPMEHLNCPAFFIVFEHPDTTQTDGVGHQEGELPAVLPLPQHHQFDDTNLIHHHRCFKEPFEPLLIHLGIHTGECLHRERSGVGGEADPCLANQDTSVGLRLGHPSEATAGDELRHLVRHVPLVEHDSGRRYLCQGLPQEIQGDLDLRAKPQTCGLSDLLFHIGLEVQRQLLCAAAIEG